MAVRRWSFAMVAALALGLSAAACGSSSKSSSSSSSSAASKPVANVAFSSIEQTVPSTYPQPKPGKFRLGYLNPEGGNEFLGTLGNAMRLEAKKLGGTYTELDAGGDVNKQVSQFDQLIAQKVDGIAVFALRPEVAGP